MIVELFAFVIITSCFMLKWHLEHHFSQFKRLGIKGPPPSFLTGNLRDIREKGQFACMVSWSRQFGRVFGYYEGYTPVLSVSEPEVLREVLVKDAANFMSRKPFPLAPRKSLGLFLENGDQWRRSRSLLTPAFSTGKLKKMLPIMGESADILVEQLQDRVKESPDMDIYSVFQSLTLDVIGRCAFGLKTQAQMDENDPFLVNIKRLFHVMTTTVIQHVVMALPFVSNIIFALKNVVMIFGMNPVVWLRNSLREVIVQRKALGPNGDIIDLVQLMLFPEPPQQHDALSEVHHTKYDAMSDREVVAQSMTFLLAGYETTSAVLAFFCHEMARHPEVQEELLREMEECVKERDIDYESIQNLPLFDATFDEICRLYPTASFIVTRQAASARQYGSLSIPAGMNVMANVWALHRDEHIWDRSGEFIPQRFLAKSSKRRSSFEFLPFGAGPRHCIGMRFATLEAKVTLVKFLKNFKVERAPDYEEDLELISRGAIVPKGKVNVKVTKRVTSGRRRNVRHC